MVKALADRLAEAFAEYIHLEARRAVVRAGRASRSWRTCTRSGSAASGPALGYPASPDHSEKELLFELLEASALGIGLTENYAMTPAAAVSGLIFQHPGSRYFTVGRIDRDQVEDYAARRGHDVAEVERWLRPNLAYDPK